MRNKRLIQSGILAAAIAVACLGAGAGMARADVITLDVSGTLTASSGTGGSCVAAGCTLGGTLVINNTTGAVVSVDVTMSGESPTVGTFTEDVAITKPTEGLTALNVSDASGDVLGLVFATTTPGSLVGYDGGSLSINTNMNGSSAGLWFLTSGSLTPAATTPEPASLLLFGTGLLGLAYFVRRREKSGAVEL